MKRSAPLGCVGSAVFVLFGLIFAGIGGFKIMKPEWEVRHRFVETRCTIEAERIVESKSKKKSKRRTSYRPEFDIRYEVAGKTLRAKTYAIANVSDSRRGESTEVLNRFDVGRDYPCWYDPDDPNRVVLDRSYSKTGMVFTGIGLLVVLVGLVGALRAMFRGAFLVRALAGR